MANILGVVPDEITDYLTRRLGSSVDREEIIAESRPLITWFKTAIHSPVDGTIEAVSTVTGQVMIREKPRALNVCAYVQGRVEEVQDGQGVTIVTDCSLVQGIFGIGGETWGTLALAVNSPEQPCTPSHLTADMQGKIVVGGAFLGIETMKRAQELGLAGLVAGGIHDKDLQALLGYDLGVAMTGTERIGLTLAITEGFGTIPMAGKTFDLLARHAGRQASLSGATQIRAGVIRPEIIIPRPKDNSDDSPAPCRPSKVRTGIQINDLARIIRDPVFGRVGTVVGLPTDLRTIDTESAVRVLDIEFDDGRRITVPRANVEILEEG